MLTAYYDLSLSPPTYDFVSFLLHAEAVRRNHREEHTQVAFLPGPVGGFRKDRLWPHSVEERQGLLDRVVKPMCGLLPSCVGWRIASRGMAMSPSVGFKRHSYGLPIYVKALRQYGPTLKAPSPLYAPKLVTITLRECEHWPERNSNTAEWLKAAQEIEGRGYRIVFVRDTLRSSEEIEGFTIDPLAATDIIARANLYASAACNLFVSTGPAWLAVALGAPVLIFRPVTEGSPNPAARSPHFVASGIARCGQVPGTLPSQVLVWEADDCDLIVQAFDKEMVR